MGLISDGSRMGTDSGKGEPTYRDSGRDLAAAHDLAMSVGRMASWRFELATAELT